MQVYVELALLENFCMDFTLLYCAKLVSANRAHAARIALASFLGACFAVVFPLFALKGVWAVAVKLISGMVICLIGGKFGSLKAYFKMTAVFTAFTFILGGALIAAFSLTGAEYVAGSGYALSSVPVGIPLFCALLLVIAARKIRARLKKSSAQYYDCKIYFGEKFVAIKGFFDSGNKVSHMGQPVSVIPLAEGLKLCDVTRIKEQVKIHTVAGSKKLKIFTADKIEICKGDEIKTIKKVKIGLSAHASGVAVLHPDLLEDVCLTK